MTVPHWHCGCVVAHSDVSPILPIISASCRTIVLGPAPIYVVPVLRGGIRVPQSPPKISANSFAENNLLVTLITRHIWGRAMPAGRSRQSAYFQNMGWGYQLPGRRNFATKKPTPPPGTAAGWFPRPWRRPSSGRSALAAGSSARCTRSRSQTGSETAR